LVRVEEEALAFGEDKLIYQVPVVEVRLEGVARRHAAAAAPAWSTLPWHLLALLDEGARRGDFKLDEVDRVRDAAAVGRLDELARELEERGHVPPALKSHATAQEARSRYRRLREFHAAHGHWLVTNGPYRLERWDGSKAVLAVFRDASYPNGLGRFNAYAVPLKAYVTRIERRPNGARVHLEAERLQRESRDVRIVRGPPEKDRMPVCRYLLLGAAGGVAAAGEVRAGTDGRCHLPLKGAVGRLLIAAVLDDGAANAPVRTVAWE
jgi:peptide/nickel transport system substrate-binding protein